MKTVALLPGRCGSKGILKKNIYPINGVPLIGYCLNAIKQSSVNEYYVSTDCDEIADVAKNFGAKIIQRPKKLAADNSPTIDCIKHAISYLKLSNNDIVLTIQPTSPLILANDIDLVIKKMNSGQYSYVISVTSDHSFLWQKYGEYIVPKDHDPINRIRRQDMIPTFKENGAIYATTCGVILNNNTLYGHNNCGYVEIPKSRSFEVDDYEDIKIIEKML